MEKRLGREGVEFWRTDCFGVVDDSSAVTFTSPPSSANVSDSEPVNVSTPGCSCVDTSLGAVLPACCHKRTKEALLPSGDICP